MNLQRIKENIIYTLRRVMYGRYGFDQLSWVLFGVAMLASLAARFAGIPWLMFIYYAGFFLCMFRVLSRNIYKRQQENWRFLSKTRSVTAWFRLRQKMLQERKAFRYLRCADCKQWLRVPRGKGKISISCSKCHREIIKTV